MSVKRLPPSGIGLAAKYNFSPWFIKLRFENKDPIKNRRWKEATKPLSPVQSKIGNRFEDQVYEELDKVTNERIDSWFDWGDERNKEKIISKIRDVSKQEPHKKPTILTQARLNGHIGEFDISGDSDLVILFPRENQGVRVHIIDIKSSWKEKPSQQLQTATYTLIMRNMLEDTDIDYDITGGILYRETRMDEVLDHQETPEFNVETREGDVRRILSEDGPFKRAFDSDFSDIPLNIDRNSPYSEVTTVEAIENNDLSILGLSPSEKEIFNDVGVNSIEDVAMLYEIVDDPKPYNYDEPEVNDEMREKVEKLKQKQGLSSKISKISQIAQSLLGEIKPDHKFSHDKPWMPWIQGSGDGQLPEDNPPYESSDLDIKRNSMIRVYLDVQYDHVRDEIVAFSGSITSGQYDGSPLEFSHVISNISENSAEWRDKYESELLQDSLSDMFNTIQFFSDFANHGSHSPVHFYLYDQREFEKLYEAVNRHQNEHKHIKSFRSLMDKRQGIDQKMFSIVEDEIRERFAPKSMDLSAQNILKYTYPSESNAKFEDDDWIVDEGDKIDLSNAFYQQMFDSTTPIKSSDSKVLNYNNSNTSEADAFFETVPKSGSNIPIEYLWASEDINILDKSWTDNSRQKSIIDSYMWVDSDKKQHRISSDLYKHMSKKLTNVLYHIERSIQYRNTDITKKNISISNITQLDIDKSTIPQSCIEYLDLESSQNEKDALQIYSKPIKKRVADGESLPIQVTNIIDEKSYMFKVEADLLIEELGFDNPVEIAGSSKLSGGDGNSGGSRCVATSIIKSGGEYKAAVEDPDKISRSTKVSIDSYDPDNQKLILKGYRQSGKLEYKYVKGRKPWTLDPSDIENEYIGPGESFILDPSPDNIMAEKSLKALRNSMNDPVYKDINNIHTTGYDVDQSHFDDDNIVQYINTYKKCLDFEPNKKQKKFITNVMKYVLLQGPPGTGKTSGAVAHAVLSRAYCFENQGKVLNGLVTGLSNKSVNEVLSDVSELKNQYDEEFDNHNLENIRLVRLTYDKPEKSSDNIEYLNYQNEEDLEILKNMLKGKNQTSQKTFKSTNGPNEHVIIFSTPGRIESLVGKIDDGLSSEEMYEESPDLFDFISVDEASMMPMYQFFMITTFTSPDSQIQLAGDHRQLPPVQKYDWTDENRSSIINNLPHLSVLDYFRYLKNDIDMTYDDSPKSPKADIPIIQLNETYRCHKTVTEFLRRTVYEKDNLPYDSNQTDTMNENISDNNISKILNPESPLTLIIHDDRQSRQNNIPEKNLISEITDYIKDESVGVVTPHNSQKGKLSVECSENVEIDTVERFQGGEKDVMFLSTTVSDPTQLSDEEDFILSHRRLNVALSRMKKKLVVVAPKTVFELVPDECDIYDEAVIWKSLYSISNADKEPDFECKLSDINKKFGNTNIESYHINQV